VANATPQYGGPVDETAPYYHDQDEDQYDYEDRGTSLSRVGDFLIFLTAADREKLRSHSERQRYITIGLLMMVTAIQGFYAACLLASIGFKKPFDQVLGFGLFFAIAVYLIDRSIIGYVAPARLDSNGNPKSPRKVTPVVAIRLVIATAAAILMSEMVLLQFFASDISAQVQTDHLSQTKQTDSTVIALYQKQIVILQSQISTAQAAVNQRNADYLRAQKQANCQEFGCPGITAGMGPGFRAAENNLSEAQNRLKSAQGNLENVTKTDTPQINTLNRERNAAVRQGQQTITNANALLTREEAFWQLTTEHGTVAFWRIMLTLLILGIDLAPLLTKLTGKTTLHDTLVRHDDHVASESSLVDMQSRLEEIMTRKLANSGRERVRRERDSKRTETELQRVLAQADEDRFGTKLNTDLRKRQLYRFYTSGRSRAHSGYRPTIPITIPVIHDSDQQKQARGNSDDIETVRMGLGPPEPELDSSFHEPSNESDPFGYPDDLDDAFFDQSLTEDVAEIIFGNSWEGLVLGNRWALRDRMPHADAGSGGVVWRAKDVDDAQRWYVVKTFSGDAGGTPEATGNLQRRSFQSEKRMQKVRSDHIGEIADFGTDKGFYYIVYPLYKPGSLSLYCRGNGGHRTLHWCTDIIRQVLTGLIDASGQGFVHLDIKPGNLVLDGHRARIIDWGLSRMWQGTDNTYTVVPRGSPFFASPEQLQRATPGWDKPTADLYSVGAVFYWLIAGEAPLRQDADEENPDHLTFMKLVVAGVRPQPVHELVPGVLPQLGELIGQWLSANPADRVPAGTPPDRTLQTALGELDALLPFIQPMTVGTVTGRRRLRKKA
jgi:Domain of unknown function (DUF4407)/Protein kinase domain